MKLRVVYVPGERAFEYAGLACNLYRGCFGGCLYCYAAVDRFKKRKREDFHRGMQSYPDILKNFEADCEQLAILGNTEPIHLCFTCDPYGQSDIHDNVTRRAIIAAHKFGQNVNILTKFGRRAMCDLNIFEPGDIIGASITCLTDQERAYWEPGTDSIGNRLLLLRMAKDIGIRTRASIEPPPADSIENIIEFIRIEVRPVADLLQIGKLNLQSNNHPSIVSRQQTFDWTEYVTAIDTLAAEIGGEWQIKHDLARCRPGARNARPAVQASFRSMEERL